MDLLKQKRIRWLLIGVAFSFLGPIGEWVILKFVASNWNQSIILTYIYAEVTALLAFGLFGFVLGTYADRLEKLALTDRLTGLKNRHFIMDQLGELLNLQQRYHSSFSVIMLDLDHFKQVNDLHGHPVGDQTLVAVSKTIATEVRDTDSPCRFGGEEFLILCPYTNLDEAYNLAERIRLSIKSLKKDELGHPGPQTISAGVFEVAGNRRLSVSAILSKVDQALYQAKSNGRNQVARG